MAVKTEKDLPEHLRATWLKAMSAMELKNYGYAVQLLQSVLKQVPDFLAARQLARRAAKAKASGKKSLLSVVSSSSFSTMKAQGLLKKDPLAALDAVEKILEGDPMNASANMLLRDAAVAAGFPEVAAFALETIIEGNPKDAKTMHELAQHYMKFDEPDKAVEVYSRILEIAPHDLVAVKGGKDAAARASIKSGGWEVADSYRDLIKDKEEAVALEQQSRVVRDDDAIDNLLASLHEQSENDPGNVDVARRIGDLYEQKLDLENAITWLEYAAALNQNADASLVKRVADLRLRQLDECIASREQFIAQYAEQFPTECEQYQAEVEDFRRRRATMEVDEARLRVDRNPTDLFARFEYGESLLKSGNYRDAIPELQRARQNPNVRLKAMNLLSQCYSANGMLDLAAKTLADAASEIMVMDATKKDITYNLGLVYERMGDMPKSVECMKQIYEVDYSYRDVAQRVEGSYGG